MNECELCVLKLLEKIVILSPGRQAGRQAQRRLVK